MRYHVLKNQARRIDRKESSMDRNYWYHQAARERQAAIAKELATRHLLQNVGRQSGRTRHILKVVVRIAPIAAIGVFILYRVIGY